MKQFKIMLLSGLLFTQLAYAEQTIVQEQEQKLGQMKHRPACDLVNPTIVYRRVSQIPQPSFTCINDGEEYITQTIRGRDGSVEIEINFEDNLDGTWYASISEYKPYDITAIKNTYRYSLSLEQVLECRAAFKPPIDCFTPE